MKTIINKVISGVFGKSRKFFPVVDEKGIAEKPRKFFPITEKEYLLEMRRVGCYGNGRCEDSQF